MRIVLNNFTMTITATHEADGTYISVTTDSGEWSQRASDRQLPIETDKDVANVLAIPLSVVQLMEDFPTYRHYLDYIEHCGDEEEEGSLQYFEHWQDVAHEWNEVTRHLASEVMDYLKQTYETR